MSRVVRNILFIGIFSLIYLNFSANIFQTASLNRFANYEAFSESFVVGRLALSREEGVFARRGQLGRAISTDGLNKTAAQYGIFLESSRPQYSEENQVVYEPYLSQIGLQGIFYSLIASVGRELLGLPEGSILSLCKNINCMLMASMVLMLLLWINTEFGLLAVLAAVVFAIGAPWFVVFGRNLYWNAWSFLLPMLIVLLFHWREANGFPFRFGSIAISLIGSALFRFGSGFEFASTVMIASLVPVVYYSIVGRWNLKKFIRRSFDLSIFLLTGFLFAQVGRFVQLVAGGMTYEAAWTYIFFHIKDRAIGNQSWSSTYLLADVWRLTSRYLSYDSISLLPEYVRPITFAQVLLIWLGLASFWFVSWFLLGKRKRSDKTHLRKCNALQAAFSFSLLAPVSWFALGREHASIHDIIVPLLWYLPSFLLVGPALVAMLQGIIAVIGAQKLSKQAPRVLGWALLILLASLAGYRFNLRSEVDYTSTERFWNIGQAIPEDGKPLVIIDKPIQAYQESLLINHPIIAVTAEKHQGSLKYQEGYSLDRVKHGAYVLYNSFISTCAGDRRSKEWSAYSLCFLDNERFQKLNFIHFLSDREIIEQFSEYLSSLHLNEVKRLLALSVEVQQEVFPVIFNQSVKQRLVAKLRERWGLLMKQQTSDANADNSWAIHVYDQTTGWDYFVFDGLATSPVPVLEGVNILFDLNPIPATPLSLPLGSTISHGISVVKLPHVQVPKSFKRVELFQGSLRLVAATKLFYNEI